jgi:hypothetical protein
MRVRRLAVVDLALELGKEHHVEGQPTPRARRVELLCHRHERHTLGVEDLDQPGKVGERAGQPVYLVDDHDIDPPRPLLQSGPLHCRAGKPAVVIASGQAHPPLGPTAVDEGLAGFTPRLQRERDDFKQKDADRQRRRKSWCSPLVPST